MLEEDDDTVDDITESTSSPSIPSATVDKMVDVSTVVELHLHMVFSATYRVPHLMFQAFDPSECESGPTAHTIYAIVPIDDDGISWPRRAAKTVEGRLAQSPFGA